MIIAMSTESDHDAQLKKRNMHEWCTFRKEHDEDEMNMLPGAVMAKKEYMQAKSDRVVEDCKSKQDERIKVRL